MALSSQRESVDILLSDRKRGGFLNWPLSNTDIIAVAVTVVAVAVVVSFIGVEP